MSATFFKESYRSLKPLSTNNFREGMKRHSREQALEMRFIETYNKSTPNMIVLDVDIDHASLTIKDMVYEDGLLPEPNFITTNPISTHAQVGYIIEGFVSSPRAIRFFEGVRKGLTVAAGGDAGYGGRTMRNPLSPFQVTEWTSEAPLSLTALNAFCAPLSSLQGMISSEELTGGRHTDTFSILRKWGYRNFLKFVNRDSFAEAILDHALEINSSWEEPLPYAEIASIAKSVSQWSGWEDFNAETFSKIQQARALKRWGRGGAERNENCLVMIENGFTVKEIGENLGLTYEAAKSLVRRVKAANKK